MRSEGDGSGPLELEFVDEPGNPGPPRHWHPHAEEAFSVLEGRLALVVGGYTLVLSAGERYVVPRGVPHSFKNADPGQPVRFRSVHTPGLHFERLLGSICDLDLDGEAGPTGTPRFLPMMAIIANHPDVSLIAEPPSLLQKALAAAVGAIARLRGHGGAYRSRLRR